MKLFLTIALAVFIGNLASLSAFELWRAARAQKAAELENQKLAEQKRLRDAQGAKIRQMLLDAHKAREASPESDGANSLTPPGTSTQ